MVYSMSGKATEPWARKNISSREVMTQRKGSDWNRVKILLMRAEKFIFLIIFGFFYVRLLLLLVSFYLLNNISFVT